MRPHPAADSPSAGRRVDVIRSAVRDTVKLPIKGVVYALAAAGLFGASTPFAKLLVGRTDPVLLAGLLYLGSGVGLAGWWAWSRGRGKASESPLRRADLPWLAGAVAAGGVVGPLLLMLGLTVTPASTTSLLLNLEGVLTAVLAWVVFRENFDRRIAMGMAAIAAGGVVLSWEGGMTTGNLWGPLAIAGACLAWAIDNNLTRKLSAGDPVQITAVKGLVAGGVNVGIALARGATLPDGWTVAACAVVGLAGYGISLTLFVLALRSLGTARTGAYFSVAPFFGAVLSILLLGDQATLALLGAAALMGVGFWLHLTENHDHENAHD